MSYELEAFKIGLWAGYYILAFFIMLVYGIILTQENKKFNKFLVEIKGVQQYEEWKKKNKVSLQFVKSK